MRRALLALLLLWHPALPGQRSTAPVSLVDIAPTLLEWLGLPASGELHGRSLAQALDAESVDPQRPLFSSGIAYGPERAAVLRGDRKRIRGVGGAPSLLFDLSGDPGEQRPGTGPSPALDLLLDAYDTGRAKVGAPVAPLSPELLAELQALGYLTEVTPE